MDVDHIVIGCGRSSPAPLTGHGLAHRSSPEPMESAGAAIDAEEERVDADFASADMSHGQCDGRFKKTRSGVSEGAATQGSEPTY
ncbi:hypothetical protein RRF57_007542 [Xylaria bambusicola]|uniref:Uncharacterized protein n=1 Tax=Xylaria bambusicola TaxID=326684 RepID=A0AAN7ULA8_9PEZI